MKDVVDKVAFITGGSSGVGLGIARAFVEAGMRVIVGYRTQRNAEAALAHFAASRDRVQAIEVDVTDRAGMERAAQAAERAFGKVHVLVNNAGVGGLATVEQTTYDDWDWVLDVNLNGVFNGIRAFLPRIRAHGEGGHIVSTSSVMGLYSCAGSSAYTASKFAVTGLMEVLRAELAGTNIGVSVFCPGEVASDMVHSARNRPGHRAHSGFDWTQVTSRDASKAKVMDPLDAGRCVLAGVRNNDLYILSHGEFAPAIRERGEALLASFPSAARSYEAERAALPPWLHSDIYNIERDRKAGVLR